MHRIVSIIVLLSCLVLLASCQTDQKEATQIQDKMEKSAAYEKDFHSNQEALEKYRDKEQTAYQGLIESDIQNHETISDELEDGKDNLQKQQTLLKENKTNFQLAYNEAATIQEHVEKIHDKKQQEEATDLLDIIEARKNEIKDYFEIYQKQLNLLDTFYKEVEAEDAPIDKMEEKVDEINKNTKKIEEHIQDFNEATETYNQQEATYYETVEKS